MSQFMKAFTDTHWTLIGFVLFFSLFVFLILTTYLKSEVEKNKYLAGLPIENSNQGDSRE